MERTGWTNGDDSNAEFGVGCDCGSGMCVVIDQVMDGWSIIIWIYGVLVMFSVWCLEVELWSGVGLDGWCWDR